MKRKSKRAFGLGVTDLTSALARATSAGRDGTHSPTKAVNAGTAAHWLRRGALTLVASLLLVGAATSAGNAAQSTIIKLKPGMSAKAIVGRPDSDVIEFSNGRQMTVGAARRLQAHVDALTHRQASSTALNMKPAATGTHRSARRGRAPPPPLPHQRGSAPRPPPARGDQRSEAGARRRHPALLRGAPGGGPRGRLAVQPGRGLGLSGL